MIPWIIFISQSLFNILLIFSRINPHQHSLFIMRGSKRWWCGFRRQRARTWIFTWVYLFYQFFEFCVYLDCRAVLTVETEQMLWTGRKLPFINNRLRLYIQQLINLIPLLHRRTFIWHLFYNFGVSWPRLWFYSFRLDHECADVCVKLL
jgi:hypothetical protein